MTSRLCVCMCVLGHVQLFVTLWTYCSQPFSSSMGFHRQERWSGSPFPAVGFFPTQGSNLCLLHLLQANSFTTEPLGPNEQLTALGVEIWEVASNLCGIKKKNQFSMNLHPDEDTSTNDMEINLFTVMAVRLPIGKECPDTAFQKRLSLWRARSRDNEGATNAVGQGELLKQQAGSRESRSFSWVVCSVLQSCLTLQNPVNCSPRGSSVYEILQARILEWVAIPFSKWSSRPRSNLRLCISCIGRQILYHCAITGE